MVKRVFVYSKDVAKRNGNKIPIISFILMIIISIVVICVTGFYQLMNLNILGIALFLIATMYYLYLIFARIDGMLSGYVIKENGGIFKIRLIDSGIGTSSAFMVQRNSMMKIIGFFTLIDSVKRSSRYMIKPDYVARLANSSDPRQAQILEILKIYSIKETRKIISIKCDYKVMHKNVIKNNKTLKIEKSYNMYEELVQLLETHKADICDNNSFEDPNIRDEWKLSYNDVGKVVRKRTVVEKIVNIVLYIFLGIILFFLGFGFISGLIDNNEEIKDKPTAVLPINKVENKEINQEVVLPVEEVDKKEINQEVVIDSSLSYNNFEEPFSSVPKPILDTTWSEEIDSELRDWTIGDNVSYTLDKRFVNSDNIKINQKCEEYKKLLIDNGFEFYEEAYDRYTYIKADVAVEIFAGYNSLYIEMSLGYQAPHID